jgi:hypothetical protein
MISDVDAKKFFACFLKWKRLLEQDNPEYWTLATKNPQIFEKMVEVQPFEDRECADYSPKE